MEWERVKHENTAKQLLNNPQMPKLKEVDKILCDSPLTMHECLNALKLFKNGKRPGSDGYTAEF